MNLLLLSIKLVAAAIALILALGVIFIFAIVGLILPNE